MKTTDDAARVYEQPESAIDAMRRLREERDDLLTALKTIRAHRRTLDSDVEIVSAICSICHCPIGWEKDGSETPVCDDCVIDNAIAKADGR